MAKKTQVKLNYAQFGRHVLAGPGMEKRVREIGEEVAAKVGGTVETTVSHTGGGARVRAHVANGTTSAQEAETNELTSALMSTVRSARPS